MTHGHEKYLVEGRQMLLDHGVDFLHAYWCRKCGLRANAEAVLILLDWTADEFLDAWRERVSLDV